MDTAAFAHGEAANGERVGAAPYVGAEQETFGLVVAVHRLVRSLRREGGPHRIQPTSLIVLSLLAEFGPSRIGSVADRVPCSQPTATTAVAGLEADGLVRRQPDPSDGRATQAVITDRGAETLLSFARSEAEVLDRRLAGLSEPDRRTVLAAQHILARLAAPERQ